MNSAANEWGVPDWRDAKAYPDLESQPLWGKWRWEFVRRHPNYRDVYGEFNRRSFENDEERSKVSTEIAINVRYLDLYDPRQNEIPETDGNMYTSGNVLNLAHPAKFKYSPLMYPPDRRLVLMSFDLDMPIEMQIETARSQLRSWQKRLNGKLVEYRHEPERWSLYLRVIDAKDAGATWGEIADILPSAYQKKSNARATHKQAVGVQDKMLYYPTLPTDKNV